MVIDLQFWVGPAPLPRLQARAAVIACKRENGNVEPRNESEMGTEVCRWKTILGWAQIIERRLCEKVVWPIGVLQ